VMSAVECDCRSGGEKSELCPCAVTNFLFEGSGRYCRGHARDEQAQETEAQCIRFLEKEGRHHDSYVYPRCLPS
jgi:hypothetical protein